MEVLLTASALNLGLGWWTGLSSFFLSSFLPIAHQYGNNSNIPSSNQRKLLPNRLSPLSLLSSTTPILTRDVDMGRISYRNSIPIRFFGSGGRDFVDRCRFCCYWIRWLVLSQSHQEERGKGLMMREGFRTKFLGSRCFDGY